MIKHDFQFARLAGPALFILTMSVSGAPNARADEPVNAAPTAQKKLAVENKIISVKVVGLNSFAATLEVEYVYNGSEESQVWMALECEPQTPVTGSSLLEPGKNKSVIKVMRSRGLLDDRKQVTQTKVVSAKMRNAKAPFLEKIIDVTIDWPSADPYVLNSEKDIDRLYAFCVQSIDNAMEASDLSGPKKGLEQILLAKPEFLPAYAEIARVQMKTNWSAEGLVQAEQTLKTALRIDPKHANSLVLLGYVYAHQRRFKDAEQTLRSAEKIGTPNIWLYTNLGELYDMQEKKQDAVAAYKKAVGAPAAEPTYERARAEAYERLLATLTGDKQWTQIDELLKQRAIKFPEKGCYRSDYARFRLVRMSDYEGAITLGKEAVEKDCREDGNEVLGLAYYAKWATLLKTTRDEKQADQFFTRAQVLNAQYTSVLMSLAQSEYLSAVVSGFKPRGIGIDSIDRNGMTALAFSAVAGNLEAGRALVSNGANIDFPVGEESVTVLMLAASRGHKKFVSFLLEHGANRNVKTRSGYTAETFARENGFDGIAAMLSKKGGV